MMFVVKKPAHAGLGLQQGCDSMAAGNRSVASGGSSAAVPVDSSLVGAALVLARDRASDQ